MGKYFANPNPQTDGGNTTGAFKKTQHTMGQPDLQNQKGAWAGILFLLVLSPTPPLIISSHGPDSLFTLELPAGKKKMQQEQ